jgi:hypothetical protein
MPVATNNKLIRRLRREITANPKKAAVLALLLLVAIVFWAPLITKWTGSKTDDLPTVASGTGENATSSNLNAVAVTESSTGITTMTKTSAPQWNYILAAIRNDQRMQPHVREEGERDPFAPAPSQIAAQVQATPVEAAPEITPQQAGIVLRSTVVGTHMKTALINGRAYHEEQSVLAGNGRDRFTVVEIRENGIVLSRHGETYQMNLPKASIADGND